MSLARVSFEYATESPQSVYAVVRSFFMAFVDLESPME